MSTDSPRHSLTDSTKAARPVAGLSFLERLNFLVTNRLPRRWLTLAIGRLSRVEHPWISKASIYLWQLFVDDLRLHEARKRTFRSLHDCFVREIRPETRPVCQQPATIVSPCDAVVGEFGRLNGVTAIQAKGFPYSLEELMGSEERAYRYRDGLFVTLRLKSSMYHRFHSPSDAAISGLTYISGDTWNVNPIALKKIERLFCKNERLVIDMQTGTDGTAIALVPVAAILVASIRLHALDYPLNLRYRGPNDIECRASYKRGEEMGYFEHGSTIVLFATGRARFAKSVETGKVVRMGRPLLYTGD